MEGIPEDESGGSPEVVITFLEKDASEIHPHNDGPMVIVVKCEEWEIKRVLVDQGSFTNILYWDVFERLRLYPEDLKPFKRSLVEFSGE